MKSILYLTAFFGVIFFTTGCGLKKKVIAYEHGYLSKKLLVENDSHIIKNNESRVPKWLVSTNTFNHFVAFDTHCLLTKDNYLYAYNFSTDKLEYLSSLDFYNMTYDYTGVLELYKVGKTIVAKTETQLFKSDSTYSFIDSNTFMWTGPRVFKEFNNYDITNAYVSENRIFLSIAESGRCKISNKDFFYAFEYFRHMGELTIEKKENFKYQTANVSFKKYLEDINLYHDIQVIFLNEKIAKIAVMSMEMNTDLILTIDLTKNKVVHAFRLSSQIKEKIRPGIPFINLTSKIYSYNHGFLYRLTNTENGVYVEKWAL
jgi:hypothetical protein